MPTSAEAAAPTVTITPPSGTQAAAFDVTITFSENVTGFTSSDIGLTNGASVTSLTGSDASYTATIKPKATGDITISVGANVATSSGGEGNTAADAQTVSVNLPHSITVGEPEDGPHSEAFDVEVTFTESVGAFVANDITLSPSTLATVTSVTGSAPTYTVTITPVSGQEGELDIEIAADAVQDAADTPLDYPASNKIEDVLIDAVRSQVSSITGPSGVQNGNFDVTITFDEAVSDFDASDLTVSGGASAPSSWKTGSDGDATYTGTIDISGVSTGNSNAVTISVGRNVAEDAAGNGNFASASSVDLTVSVDNERPTTTIIAPTTPQNGAFDVTIDFGEAVTGFTVSDLSSTGGSTANNWKSGANGPQRYTITFTPGNALITRPSFLVPANVATDAAGNNNTSSGWSSVTLDQIPPKVSIIGVPSTEQKAAFDLTVTFSEDVAGFAKGDLTVTGEATATAVSAVGTSKSEYTATITPNAGKEGDVTVTVNANTVKDTAGNGNTVSAATSNIHIDTIRPTATISVPTTPQNGAFDATIDFGETVAGFVKSDVTVGGTATHTVGALSGGTNGSYTLRITPTTSGTITIDVAADVAKDSANNNNLAATQKTVTADKDPPKATITVPTTPQNGAFDVTVDFGENVTGFTANDVTSTGPMGRPVLKSGTEGSQRYTLTITPSSGSYRYPTIVLYISGGRVRDAAGNANFLSKFVSVRIDRARPTATITGVPTTEQKGAFDLTVTFSEDVTGFATGALTVTGEATATAVAAVGESKKEYTATITPNANKEGDVTVKVNADAVKDTAGNKNTASAVTSNIHVDTIRPTPTITPPTTPQNDAFSVRINFGESVTGFVKGDITLGGTATYTSRLLQLSHGFSYTLFITPTTSGTITIDVAANVARDAAGNSNKAATRKTVTVDKDAPKATITAPTTPQNGPFDVTVDFGENVTGFAATDLAGNGTTADPVLKSGTEGSQQYTLTITPTTSQVVYILLYVEPNKVTDAAGNSNVHSAYVGVPTDLIRPTATITGVPSTDQNGAFDLTVTFSEDVSGFATDDLTVTGEATATAVAAVGESKKEYTATITPNANKEGDVTVTVKADAVKDTAGNTNNASSATGNIRVDTIRPTATISDLPTTPQNGAFDLTVTFSEDVTGMINVSVTGLVNMRVSGSGSSQTVTITPDPNTEGPITVQIDENGVQDTAGNGNIASDVTDGIHIDTIVPTVSISGVPTTVQSGAFDLTVTFSEVVSGFATEALKVTGEATATAVAAVGASKSEYTATITPNAGKEGDVTVQVNAKAVTDAAGNTNPAASATTGNIYVETIRPTPTITAPTTPQNGAFDVAINFDEPVSDFNLLDHITIGGTATLGVPLQLASDSLKDGGAAYTLTLIATTSGTITIDIPADAVTDLHGNGNNAATQATVTIDVDAPTPTITVPTALQNGAFDVTVDFGEDVTGFVVGDLTVANATKASDWKSGADGSQTYTITLTPTITAGNTGTVTIDIAASVATNAATNSNKAATQKTVTVDKVPPTATITAPTTPQNSPFDVTVDFSEAVTGFTAGDLTQAGMPGSPVLKSGTEGSQRYTVTVAPPTDRIFAGIVLLYVRADRVTDAAGNNNLISNFASLRVDTQGPTVVITGVPDAEQNGAFDLTVTFHEDVTGFATEDLTVTGEATATTVAPVGASKKEYTATITPNANKEGDVTVQVSADTVTDAAGNNNIASSATGNIRVDTIRPTVTSITGASTTPQNAAFDLTITFSEDVTGFATGGLTVTGEATATAVAAVGTSKTNYTATITPKVGTEGNITLMVNADAVTDAAGNGNTVSRATGNIPIDTKRPTVTSITGVPTTPQNGEFDLTVTFSEDVIGDGAIMIREDAEFGVVGSTVVSGSGNSQTVTITPDPNVEGSLTVQIVENSVTDAAGNGNTASAATDSIRIDTIVPTATISGVPTTEQNGAFTFTITFNEDVTGFAATDLTVTGPATATLAGSGSSYTATITPDANAEGVVTLQIPASAVEDLAGNVNTAFDLTDPIRVNTKGLTVELEDVPDTVQLEDFSVLIVFSTDVEGFALEAIEITGDAVVQDATLLGSGSTYNLTITPDANTDGDVIITVPADVAHDATGKSNAASVPQRVAVAPNWMPDASLRAAFRKQLGLDEGEDFTQQQLRTITTLELELIDINDLKGAEQATGLTTLVMQESGITDITSLRRLTQLTTLNLAGNAITDITPLAGLTGLTSLNLSGNGVTSVAALEKLTSLTTLDLSDNALTDISVVANFTGLTTLNLSGNSITDISALAALTRLTVLNLNGNSISDFTPLTGLTALTTLELGGTGMSSLNAISGLTELTTLNLSENTVSNLTGLNGLTKLTTLELADNVIDTVSSLTSLTVLTLLDLTDNGITDVGPLADLAKLETLRLMGNPILNTAPLYPLTQRVQAVDIDIEVSQYPPWDVNADGIVDAADAALVTAALGQTGDAIVNPRTDVNGDGTVDNADLTLVTDNLVGVAAAPAAENLLSLLDAKTLRTLDRETLETYLHQLRVESDGSLKYRNAIAMLEGLLAALRPTETRLLANYPNPFNPETWLPYELAVDSSVEIFIYDARGVLVRQLALGHQPAGYYVAKSRAAYWDGRNKHGERVSSGVYFYQLRAGDVSQLRKMVILK